MNRLKLFMGHVIKTKRCWLYKGTKSPAGYGRFWDGKKTVMAHRYSYFNFIGEIPTGLVLDHICRVKNCVRPEHLRSVTDRENIMCGIGVAAINYRKKFCLRGHLFDTKNTRYRKDPNDREKFWRICRKCNSIHRTEFNKRRVALGLPIIYQKAKP